MVSSEAVPFAKSGGLADMVSALTRALARAGHDVRIVLPRYYCVPRTSLEKIEGPLCVPVGWGEEWCAVYRGALPGTEIPVYFLDHERFFGRDGIYGTKDETDFRDNPQRFAFFSRAVFQLCRKLRWMPDILHAHDWPAALVPVYRRYVESATEFSRTATVFSIHNLGYQGIYSKEIYPYFRLPWELFHKAGLEYYDAINMLKGGLASADQLSTVSPSYAREIQTPEYGCSLDGLLRARSADLVGILNGVDFDDWDSASDRYLAANYSSSNLSGKAECKAALQREFGLPENPDIPLVGMVTRLTDQKGIGELFGPLYGSAFRICQDMILQMVVLGSGDRWCEDELRGLSAKLPNFRAKIGYSDRLAHMIEGGADFFLMPSRYEPCGLNQMYSLRYGTLPIVRRTGGLADTVENYRQDTGEGTGFLFDLLTPRAIYDTVGWAVWAYYNKRDHIAAMRARAMTREFSWDRAAGEYGELYARAALHVRGSDGLDPASAS